MFPPAVLNIYTNFVYGYTNNTYIFYYLKST